MLTKAKAAGVLWFFTLVGLFFLLGMAGPPEASAWDITVTAPENGKITPITDSNVIPVPEGGSKLFTIKPSSHYQVETILIDGLSVGLTTGDKGSGILTAPTGKSKVYKFNFTNVTANHSITATFAIDTFNLTVDKTSQSSGTGTITGININCGDDCIGENIAYNTLVELTAVADAGSTFEKWSGCKSDKLDPTKCTVLVKKANTVRATFTHTHTLTVTIAGDETGTVNSGKIINCTSPNPGAGDCTEVYKWTITTTTPKVITLNAVPSGASTFAGWTGDYTASTNQLTVTMDDDKDITATFGQVLPPPNGTAMQIASKVNVIEAKSGTTVKPLRIGQLGAPPTCPSDYCNDQTSVYVEESSAQTFNTINEILCAMAQSKYDLMVNEGAYKAQIDKSLCKSGKDDASSAGESSQNSSSGTGMPDYEMWTLESFRQDDSSPQTVKAWIHQKGTDYEPEMLIYAKVVITEGVSETNPYGLFTVNFKGNPVIGGEVVPFTLMKGFMTTEMDSGKVLLKFTSKMDTTEIPPQYNEGIPQFTYIDSATLDKGTNGTGQGTVYIYELGEWAPQGDDVTYNLAFDNDYFHRMEPGYADTEMCLDRYSFDESVWSYGLYNQDGSRVNRNSGFSIKATAGGHDYYGWIGYWGLWFPNAVAVNNGDNVSKINYSPGGPEEVPYTVVKSGGKLKKYIHRFLTLFDIRNVPLDYSTGNGGAQGDIYRVKWDGTDFVISAKFDPNTNIWGPLSQADPTKIDLTSLSYDMLYFNSQALNGTVQVKLNYWDECSINPGSPPTFSCPASDATPVNSFLEDLIYPSDTLPASLVCFSNCPNAANLSAEDPFNHYDWEPQINTLPPASQHAVYTFDKNAMVLLSGTTPVVTTTPAPNFPWGITSGPLFDPSLLYLLECEMNPVNPLDPDSTCGWKTWSELPEYYIWETGPNSWNQFTALKDGTGAVLEFEPPLQVSYVHTWQAGEGGQVGTTSTFNLDYSGFGNLNGIPGKCVDPDTGNDIPCGPDSRWIPQFNIPEGAQVDDVVTATPYFVKPLDMEQRMKEADLENCSTLALQTFVLPNINDFVDPNLGDEPVVDGPPAVIGGEVMY